MRRLALIAALIVLAASPQARAADPVPGAACGTGGYITNSFMWAGGPENGGVTNGMFCNGSTWSGVINFQSSGGKVGIGNTAPGALLDIGKATSTLGTMRLEGNTSGYVQLQPAAAAGSWTMTLPTGVGTSGYFLKTDGAGVTSWAAASGSATPAGSNGQIQFNSNGSALGASSSLFWDDANKRLGIGTATPFVGLQVQSNAIIGPNGYGALYNSNASLEIDRAANNYFVMENPGVSASGLAVVGSGEYYMVTQQGGLHFRTGILWSGNWATSGTEDLTILNGGNVGIGTTSPSANLHVSPVAAATGTLTALRVTGAANTNQTLSTEIPDLDFNLARTVQWATGALAIQRAMKVQPPTLGFVGASTVTDAATVGITGAPVKGTNATVTNTHGLLISAGAVGAAGASYGLTVNAQTGATANYAAEFLGGNVGIGTTTPVDSIESAGGLRVAPSSTLGAIYTTTSSAINASQTSITVASTSGFPSAGRLTLSGAECSYSGEVLSYTGKTATTFTGLTRGIDGTSGVSCSSGSRVNFLIMSSGNNTTYGPKFWISSTGVLSLGAPQYPAGANSNRTDVGLMVGNNTDVGSLSIAVGVSALATWLIPLSQVRLYVVDALG